MMIKVELFKLTLTAFLSSVIALNVNAKPFLGAELDPDKYENTPKTAPLSRGNFTELPSQYSLKSHLPPILSQGEQGSCVGWSSAYAARTLLDSKAKPQRKHSNNAFSPSFVYNQIRLGQQCKKGSYIPEALDVLKYQGVLPLSQFPYNENQCFQTPSASQKQAAAEHRIGDWRRLFSKTSTNRHIPVRRALAQGHPVVIGMNIPESFFNYKGGVYRATKNEYKAIRSNDPALQRRYLGGGHAMTAIGYNDQQQWIEVANSWGTDWGEKGFIRISWDTFNTFVREGYEMIPPPPAAPPKPQKPNMHLSLRFVDAAGTQMKVKQKGAGWELLEPVPSGGLFRVEASPKQQSYIYVIGVGSDNAMVTLFPRNKTVSPVINHNETMLLPGPTEQHFTRLDDNIGKDRYLVLASKKSLNISQLEKSLKRSKAKNLEEKLKDVLGEKFVDLHLKKMSNDQVDLAAVVKDEQVATMTVTINHVSSDGYNTDKRQPIIVLTSPSKDNFDTLKTTPFVVDSHHVTLIGKAQDTSAIKSVAVEDATTLKFSNRGPFKAEVALPEGKGPHSVLISATDIHGNRAEKTVQFIVQD
ncbi:MAG: C1 family peptidase [Pontibacterium sp.]